MKAPEKAALAAVLTLSASAVGALVFAQSAEAHTPGTWADCSSVGGSMSNTPDDTTTTITVRVDGDKQSSTFVGNGSFSLPVPQDTSVHEYRIEIDSSKDQYDRFELGTVGPCATEPTVPPEPTEPPVTEPPVPSEPPSTPPPAPEPPAPSSPPQLIPPTTYTPPADSNPPAEQTYPEPYCLGVALVTEDEGGKSYDNGNPACAGEDSREEGA